MLSKKTLRTIIITEVPKLLCGKHHLGIYVELWSVSGVAVAVRAEEEERCQGQSRVPLALPSASLHMSLGEQEPILCRVFPPTPSTHPWIRDAGSHILAYSLAACLWTCCPNLPIPFWGLTPAQDSTFQKLSFHYYKSSSRIAGFGEQQF